MPERIQVSTGAVSGVRAPAGPRAARFFAVGQTQFGSLTPTVVRSMRDYVAQFGARIGGPDMYDAAEFFLGNAAGELVVVRAYGPGKVAATASLDAGKITVTAKNPGAFYNAWTATYTAASKTLTIAKGAASVSYTGADAAGLASAASVDPDVTVAVGSLPAGNVTATNLAGGTDDFANVAWATVLSGVSSLFGSGVIAAPGVPGAASALAAHAAVFPRWALLSTQQTGTAAAAVTSQGAIVAGHKQYASYCYGWGRASDGLGGLKVIDPVSYVAAVRAKAISVFGAGTSALSREAHSLVSGYTPLSEPSSAEFDALVAAGVVTVRTLASGTGVDEYATAAGVNGLAALTGAQFRDVVNAVVDECGAALDRFVGQPAAPLLLAQAESALSGVLGAYRGVLAPEPGPTGHPGYRVSVNNGIDPADNRIQATVSLRFAETVEFVDLIVIPASANQAI